MGVAGHWGMSVVVLDAGCQNHSPCKLRTPTQGLVPAGWTPGYAMEAYPGEPGERWNYDASSATALIETMAWGWNPRAGFSPFLSTAPGLDTTLGMIVPMKPAEHGFILAVPLPPWRFWQKVNKSDIQMALSQCVAHRVPSSGPRVALGRLVFAISVSSFTPQVPAEHHPDPRGEFRSQGPGDFDHQRRTPAAPKTARTTIQRIERRQSFKKD